MPTTREVPPRPDMDVYPVICPTCFEEFTVPLPSPDEVPAEVDYDCEVCCSPMLISCHVSEGLVAGFAQGIGD